MSVLSDIDIQKYIQNKHLEIEPFIEMNLTPNGYDLTIAEIFIKKNNSIFNEGLVIIPPQTWFVISTKEFIKMGSELSSQLWIRSSYARKGIFASFGKVDAGFHGTLTISCFNSNDIPIEIPIGDRFCQIVLKNFLQFLQNYMNKNLVIIKIKKV